MKAKTGNNDGPNDEGSGRVLDEVVLTAASLDPEERESYLQKIAADSAGLADEARRRIEAAQGMSRTFLNVAAADRLEDERAPDSQSVTIALPVSERYELGEMLGEGGMGRVIKAYDRQLERHVAIKFLSCDDPAITRLFMREARAQARVRHPNVLDVYDSGELDGQPYITMRLVPGGSLAGIGPALTLEHKVGLMIQAAEGLHAAHRAGLVHRDIKPSNVLVEKAPDGELRVQVADFGLAAKLADTEFESDGLVAGSPQYIAPERLEPETVALDRRSDVYSLGVTMYWLFTGSLPYDDDHPAEVLRRVRREEPVPPRQRQPQLPRELEAVILRCIARDPQARYPSARAVARDLQRFLDGEVVEAYAAGLAYRMTRIMLRNKLLAVLAGVAVATFIIASIAVTVFALHADAARARAELRQGQAEELIRFMVVDLHDKLASLSRLDVLDDVGAAAMEYFAAVPDEALSEEELLRRSRMLYQIGEVRISQGDLAGAMAPMGQSLALAKRLTELRPDDGERLFELGQSHFWVGFVHWQQGDLAKARAHFERHRDISQALTKRDPDNLDWQRELGYARSNLGSLLQAEGDLEAALAQFRAALAIDRLLVEASDESAEALFELAATHNMIGVALQDMGRIVDAGEHLRAELSIRRGLLETETANPRFRDFLGTSHSYMGVHYSMLGDWASAETHFNEMQAIFSSLVEHDPTNTGWRFKQAWSQINLGRAAFARGTLDAAASRFDQARDVLDELLALSDEATPQAWRRSAAVARYHQELVKLARQEPRGPGLEEALAMLQELSDARPTDRSVHRWLGQTYLLLGAFETPASQAAAAFEQAAGVLESFAAQGQDWRLLAPLATALSCQGRAQQAQAIKRELEAIGYREPGLDLVCPEPSPVIPPQITHSTKEQEQ